MFQSISKVGRTRNKSKWRHYQKASHSHCIIKQTKPSCRSQSSYKCMILLCIFSVFVCYCKNTTNEMVLQVTQKTWPSQLSHPLRFLSIGQRAIYRRKRRILTLWSINVTQRSWKPQYGSGCQVILCTWQTCIPMSNMKCPSVTKTRETLLLNLLQHLNSVRFLKNFPNITQTY